MMQSREAPAPAGYRRTMDATERTQAREYEERVVREHAAAVERGEIPADAGEHYGSVDELLLALGEAAGRYRAAHPETDAA